MSTPMPPPPPPRRRSDDASANSLSNADFRRMVIDTPRRMADQTPRDRPKKKGDETPRRAPPIRKYRPKTKLEEKKAEDDEFPKYRDRAKERREDQNPDYEVMGAGRGIGAFHAVAPPNIAAESQKLSIEKSKYLGGDVEHTHLVKGLDYALLNKVRSEMENVEPEEPEEKPKLSKPWSENEPLAFHSALAKAVHRWTVKPQTVSNKTNEMFLPGRMAFVFDMEDFSPDIPTTLHRSKDDCPHPQDYVAVGVDDPVLDRISKIMAYLKLGSSGKAMRKRKKEKLDAKAKPPEPEVVVFEPKVEDVEVEKPAAESGVDQAEPGVEQANEEKPQDPEEEIFEGVGVDYVATVIDGEPHSPRSEDMEESPREGRSYFDEQQTQLDPLQGPAMPPGDWQAGYPAAPPEETWPTYYNQTAESSAAAVSDAAGIMSQEEKDRGLGSVFKRDDGKLRQRRERDAREKDPTFVSESYSECYPGYQEYNREIVDSDEEEDLTKMDMGGKGKGRLHRWDFESEEDWAKYNDRKEATPKAAFQFGVKMQDGRKTKKQKDQKLNNELNKINQIWERKKKEAAAGGGAER